MKYSLAFLAVICAIISTVNAVLTCYCGDVPLVTDRYKQCCDQVHGTTNSTTGACNVSASNGDNEEKFVQCCEGALAGVSKVAYPGGQHGSTLEVVNKIKQFNGRCDEQ